MITLQQLQKLFPTAKPNLLKAVVDNWHLAEEAEIETLKRRAMFLSMIGVETGGLRAIVENLNYTTAAQIRKIWPTRFKTESAATPFVRQPQKLANFVYGGRLGNHGQNTDDGWLFRGGGMLMTTGRENYRKRGKLLRLDLESRPELLRDPATAFRAAVTEWRLRGCNAFADRTQIRECRQAINGGTIGLREATAYYALALHVLNDDEDEREAAPASFVDLPDANEDVADDDTARMPDVDVAVAAVAPSEDLVRLVQRMLREKGYPEVGNEDGKFGQRTSDAILAFQNNNGIALNPNISSDLVTQIASAPMRDISQARATATAKDLKDAPSISLMQKLKVAAFGALGVGTGGAGLNVQDALDRAESIRDAVLRIGPWVILIIGGGLVVFFAGKFIREQVVAYREGRHV